MLPIHRLVGVTKWMCPDIAGEMDNEKREAGIRGKGREEGVVAELIPIPRSSFHFTPGCENDTVYHRSIILIRHASVITRTDTHHASPMVIVTTFITLVLYLLVHNACNEITARQRVVLLDRHILNLARHRC